MDFDYESPGWEAEGEENEDLKTTGFTAGYKPPASIFNWFWTRVSNCISELQSKISSLDSNKAKVSHQSTSTTYGMGTDNYYGHVRLSDSVSNESNAANGGYAATPAAVKAAYDAAAAVAADITTINTHAAVYAGVCSTEKSDTAKEVTINGFELVDGTVVIIKFTNGLAGYTSLRPSVATTLNINDTGAKVIGVNAADSLSSMNLDLGSTIMLTLCYDAESDMYVMTHAYATVAESAANVIWSNIYGDEKQIADNCQTYSEKPVQVGTWVDGSAVMRRTFCRALTDTEISNGFVVAESLITGSEVTYLRDAYYYIINDRVVFSLVQSEGEIYPDLIDDIRVDINAGAYKIPSTNYDGVYGYIEYVAYTE